MYVHVHTRITTYIHVCSINTMDVSKLPLEVIALIFSASVTWLICFKAVISLSQLAVLSTLSQCLNIAVQHFSESPRWLDWMMSNFSACSSSNNCTPRSYQSGAITLLTWSCSSGILGLSEPDWGKICSKLHTN